MRGIPGFHICILVLVAWGALSFGAVYPWAYWPLAAAAAAIGTYGLVWRRDVHAMPLPTGLLVALAATLIAMLVQLIPVGRETVATLSPDTTHVLENFDMRYATSASTAHALSIRPQATLVTVAMYAALTLFLLGTVRGLSFGGTMRVSFGLVALGLLLAVVGIVQKPLYTGQIYGFWTPMERATNPFGPFVNRNHYAGWMAMTLSLSLGYFCGRAAVAVPAPVTGFRRRLVWLASDAASQIALVGFAIVVMSSAMVMTLSLAGILCLVLAVFVTGLTVLFRQRSSRRVLLLYLALVVVVALASASLDRLADRFAIANWGQLNGRLGAWKDAWDISRRFMIFGSGMNTYGITTIFFQTFDREVHYAQAHNDYLQLLAEGGLLVAVPAAAAALLFVREIRRRIAETTTGSMRYWVRIGAVTGLLAIALQEVVDFSLQMPGNALLFVVISAIALHRPIDSQSARQTRTA